VKSHDPRTFAQSARPLSGPVVAENGAVVALPWHESLSTMGTRETIDALEWCVMSLGDDAATIRDTVRETASLLGVEYVDQADVEPTLGGRASVLLRPSPGHRGMIGCPWRRR